MTNPRSDEHPTWSPDSRKIAFSSTRRGRSDIYVVDVGGRSEEPLRVTNAGENTSPAWGPWRRSEARRRRRGHEFIARVGCCAAVRGGPWVSGCVGLAEFRKLQYEVRQMKAGTGSSGRIADVSAEMDAMREQLAQLEGRLEVNEHQTQQALEEAKAARMAAAQGGVGRAICGVARRSDGGPAAGELRVRRGEELPRGVRRVAQRRKPGLH